MRMKVKLKSMEKKLEKDVKMLATYMDACSAQAWLDAMGKYVLKRADMTKTDNYSAIVVRVEE